MIARRGDCGRHLISNWEQKTELLISPYRTSTIPPTWNFLRNEVSCSCDDAELFCQRLNWRSHRTHTNPQHYPTRSLLQHHTNLISASSFRPCVQSRYTRLAARLCCMSSNGLDWCCGDVAGRRNPVYGSVTWGTSLWSSNSYRRRNELFCCTSHPPLSILASS